MSLIKSPLPPDRLLDSRVQLFRFRLSRMKNSNQARIVIILIKTIIMAIALAYIFARRRHSHHSLAQRISRQAARERRRMQRLSTRKSVKSAASVPLARECIRIGVRMPQPSRYFRYYRFVFSFCFVVKYRFWVNLISIHLEILLFISYFLNLCSRSRRSRASKRFHLLVFD